MPYDHTDDLIRYIRHRFALMRAIVPAPDNAVLPAQLWARRNELTLLCRELAIAPAEVGATETEYHTYV